MVNAKRDPRRAAAADLMVEATTKEVVTGLPRRGRRATSSSRGRCCARRLFPEGDDHASADVDVLVAPEAWTRAETALARLGYEPLLLDIIPGDRPNHARPYARPDGGPSVDLHRTLAGAEAPAPSCGTSSTGRPRRPTAG